ncbi:MAG TPA: glycosyltransferase family 4 protein [Candidatus Ornithomonoglobus intestinigallinarum]|uniref:Glycosyltransferase family 4 protein n=1 Tax=Candidatus Ornithomonoglobus intestinigallinarum TaxID=2840894 RepID=A0A9D1H317_9FIRM|nr:glycosyltransferase family 4 protein [Candidatus Ornithomonoglobus intestinigallinarum]
MAKRVLMIINHHVYAYMLRKEILEACIAAGYETYITLPYGEMVEKLKKMGCIYIESHYDYHGMNPVKELGLIMRYGKIIKSVKPDVILTYTIKPNLYGGFVASAAGIPYIANVTGLGTAVGNKGIIRELSKFFYKAAFKNISCLFFQNKENMSFFERNNIAPGRHRLIPGSGVNISKFSLLEYPPAGTTEFVFISRIMKEKGIDQYLEAAKYIRGKYPNTRFHICGYCEEEYGGRLKELNDNGTVIYHGFTDNVREVLKVTHCTVHPTYYPEGMSNVLLESCASGRPVIATDRSGCREITDDGVNGYLIKERDTDDLINKLERFIALPYEDKKAMGENSRRKVEKEFDRRIVVDAYMEEIRKALGEQK